MTYLWIAFLYFTSGMPYGIINDAFAVFFRQQGVSLKEIGLLSLVGLPWTFKFFWAPAIDRIASKRYWIAASQLCFALVIGVCGMVADGLSWKLWVALLVSAVASATQDASCDGYSIDILKKEQMGFANGLRVSAYRIGLVLASGALVWLASYWGWPMVWRMVATFFLLAALLNGLWLPRTPAALSSGGEVQPAPIWDPVRRLLARDGAWGAMMFILIFKLGDYAMAPMTKPFLVDRGLGPAQIGLLLGPVAVGMTICGALLGGWFTSRVGIFKSLWMLGLIQAVSNLGYAAAALQGATAPIWAAAGFEAFSAGLGTAPFLTFLMAACDKDRSATQYALLSAFFGLARSLAGAVSGYMAIKMGYTGYFAFTFVLAFPAFLLLPWVGRWTATAKEAC
ncbi:MAG: MFS transporter [Elusimicrobiota bacterium]